MIMLDDRWKQRVDIDVVQFAGSGVLEDRKPRKSQRPIQDREENIISSGERKTWGPGCRRVTIESQLDVWFFECAVVKCGIEQRGRERGAVLQNMCQGRDVG